MDSLYYLFKRVNFQLLSWVTFRLSFTPIEPNQENIRIYKRLFLNYQYFYSPPVFRKVYSKKSIQVMESYIKKYLTIESLINDNFPCNLTKSVMIIPNLVSTKPYPETSDLKFLTLIVKKIIENNTSVTIAIGPSIFELNATNYWFKQLKELSTSYGVTLWDTLELNQEINTVVIKINSNIIEIPILSKVLEASCVINLSCSKSHNFMGWSGPIKNIMGTIPGFGRLFLHKLSSNKVLKILKSC